MFNVATIRAAGLAITTGIFLYASAAKSEAYFVGDYFISDYADADKYLLIIQDHKASLPLSPFFGCTSGGTFIMQNIETNVPINADELSALCKASIPTLK